jgi:hypothetical protein
MAVCMTKGMSKHLLLSNESNVEARDESATDDAADCLWSASHVGAQGDN